MAIDDQIDLMTEEEMDLGADPEFQDILKQLGAEEAQALMQLIKEYKEMVAQGFQGEFEDFVKVKMATAQGDDVEFQSEDEMIIEPDEMMDIEKQIVPTEMAAEGGSIGHKPRPRGNPPVFEKIEDMREWRIANPDVEDVADYKGYYERLKNPEDYDEHGWKKKRKKKQEGGIMDVVEDEEMVETTPGPTRQQMIIDYLKDRGLPITPENIQKAIIEMITGGMPFTEEAAYDMPQMDRPSVLPRGMMVDETMVDRTPRGIASLTEDVMTPPIKPMIYDAPVDQGPWDTQQSTMFAAEGGRIGAADGYKPGDFLDFLNKEEPKIQDPLLGVDLKLLKELLDSGMDAEEARIKAGGKAEGGRVPYGLGSLVKKVFKPIKKVGSKLVDSVKKVVKSPLGKAALMYAATAGAANIGAGGGMKGLFKLGTYNPATVGSNIASSWSNLKNMFSGAEKLKDSGNLLKKIGIDEKHLLRTGKERFLYGPTSSQPSGLMAMLKNPMVTIPAAMLAGGAYTAANPGEENLDRVMADRNREVVDWDNVMANIRSGQMVTPFTTGNVMFPYPNYYQNVAEGGRIGYAAGSSDYPDYSDNMFLKLVDKISPLFVDESGDFRSALQKAKFALSEFIAGKGTDLNTGAEWWNKLDDETQNEIIMEKIKWRDQGDLGGTPLYDEQHAGRYGIGGNYAHGGRIGRAEGGIMDLGGMEKDYRETGGFVPIGEYEKKDDVPARLSLNEFVMTADAVRGAGNGDVDKGAEVMEDMMETLEQQGRRHRQAQDMFSVSERLSEVVN